MTYTEFLTMNIEETVAELDKYQEDAQFCSAIFLMKIAQNLEYFVYKQRK